MILPYKTKILRPVLKALYAARSRKICKIILPYLKEKKSVIDIGCGTGIIAEMLQKKGHTVFPLDIKDISLTERIKPVIYDGKKIPAEDNRFDAALLITVLHHTRKPEELIAEAGRVAKKIIIVEDVFRWNIKKYLDFALDGLINFEIIGQPRTNKRDCEWKRSFEKTGLELIGFKYRRSHFGFCHAFYFLRKK